MNGVSRIREILFLSILFLIPLVRVSPEDFSTTRRTWIWFACIAIGIISLHILNYKRVHLKNSHLALASVLILVLSSAFSIYRPHLISIIFALIAIGFSSSAYISVTKKSAYIFLLTILCIISLYSQWSIVQFILQHDLHMQFIGESVINIHTSGVASFYIDQEKFIRSYGPFGHSNSLSGVLLIGCIVVFAGYKKLPTYFTYAISSILLLGLMTTFSRAALVASIALGIYAFIKSKNKILLLGIIPLIVFSPLLFSRSTDIHDVAAHDRIEGLRWAFKMETFPSLLRGYGIGNYQTALRNYLTKNSIQHYPWDIAPTHSIPLYILSEVGIIFFSIIVLGIFYVMKKNNLWILLFLLPPFLVDHYFITQLGPLVYLTSCAIILCHVYYTREQPNNIVH